MATPSPPLQAYDLDEAALRLERLDAEIIQLDNGPTDGECLVFPLGTVQVALVHFGRSVALRGTVPEGSALVVMAFPDSPPIRLETCSIRSDACLFAGSRARIVAHMPRGCSAFVISMPSTGTGEDARSAATVTRGQPELRIPAIGHLVALRSCMSLLSSWRRARDFGRVTELQDGLQELLRPVVADLWSRASAPLARRAERTGRVTAVSRACAHISTHLALPLTLRQLCEAAGVQARTLEYGFLECYEVGPMCYLRNARLCRVRRELMKTHPAPASVASVARRWGFTHMGQFGRDYRTLFGEAPSTTLMHARQSASQSA